jgi:ATPase subunit of ABC transporter with duplicated ATPase domains
MKEEIAAATKIQAAKRGKDARAQVRSQRVAAAEAAEVAAARARQQADAWARETREAESKAREAKLAAAELALAERIQAAEIARRSVSQSPSTRALATPAESPIVLLRQLKRLLDDGLITPKQFEVKREELLARWVNGNR